MKYVMGTCYSVNEIRGSTKVQVLIILSKLHQSRNAYAISFTE